MLGNFTSFCIKLTVTGNTIKALLIHTTYKKDQFELVTILIIGYFFKGYFYYLHDSDSTNKMQLNGIPQECCSNQ